MKNRKAPLPIVTAPVARPKAPGYKNQLKKVLENKFSSVSCAAINVVLKHVEFNYHDADRILSRIEKTKDDFLATDNAREVMQKIHVVFPTMPPNIKVFLKQNRPQKAFRVTNPTLVRDIRTAGAIDLTNDKENDEQPAKLKDELVECGCCYGDYPAKEMKECTANQGHQVCKDCINHFVSEQLDGNNSVEFKCIIDESCGHQYHHVNVLEQVLSPRLKQRTNNAIFLATAKQAGLDVWICAKCDNMGCLDDPTIKAVYCHVCDFDYCRNCHRPAHEPKTCEEMQAEDDRAKDPVNMAYEAMSKAVTRRCPNPKCLTPFVKHDGCNKMTCRVQGCGTLSCYLCGVQVRDYSHFCNHTRASKKVPCPCGKPCRLFTSTEEMIRHDRMTRQEAGRKILEEAGVEKNKINDILMSPDAKKAAESEKKTAAEGPVQPVMPLSPIIRRHFWAAMDEPDAAQRPVVPLGAPDRVQEVALPAPILRRPAAQRPVMDGPAMAQRLLVPRGAPGPVREVAVPAPILWRPATRRPVMDGPAMAQHPMVPLGAPGPVRELAVPAPILRRPATRHPVMDGPTGAQRPLVPPGTPRRRRAPVDHPIFVHPEAARFAFEDHLHFAHSGAARHAEAAREAELRRFFAMELHMNEPAEVERPVPDPPSPIQPPVVAAQQVMAGSPLQNPHAPGQDNNEDEVANNGHLPRCIVM